MTGGGAGAGAGAGTRARGGVGAARPEWGIEWWITTTNLRGGTRVAMKIWQWIEGRVAGRAAGRAVDQECCTATAQRQRAPMALKGSRRQGGVGGGRVDPRTGQRVRSVVEQDWGEMDCGDTRRRLSGFW